MEWGALYSKKWNVNMEWGEHYTLKSGMWIFKYNIFTCVKRKEDSGAMATHGH
jgi:hypothetical protein